MVLNKVLLISVLLLLKLDSVSTGPSFCVIKIIPVAAGDRGTILFKTYFKMNIDGTSMLVPVELGWLVVAADGIWEPVSHAYLDFDDGNQASRSDSVYLKEFEAPFNWENPPKSVLSTLEKYHFNHPVKPTTGKNSIVWKPDGIYRKNQRLQTRNSIRTLDYLTNEPGDGSAVAATFYQNGIALFQSQLKFNDDEEKPTTPKGAVFFQGTKYRNFQLWMDSYLIDGLVIVHEKN